MLQKGLISRHTYFSLFSNDSNDEISKAYGLSKIHLKKLSLES